MSTEAEALGERIAEMAAHLDAATHRLLTDLRDYDRSGNWATQGFPDCARWLSWRVGWATGTARDHLRVADRLGDLPLIDDALRAGLISYSKVRAMTRVATPANEAMLLEDARHATGQQLELICRKYATVVRAAKEVDEDYDRQRRTVMRRDLDDGMVRIEATLHPEEAAVVWAALDRMARERTAAAPPDAGAGTEEVSASHASDIEKTTATPRQNRFNRADALIDMAQGVLRGDAPRRSPIELVVTVAADVLRGGRPGVYAEPREAPVANGAHARATLHAAASACAERIGVSAEPRDASVRKLADHRHVPAKRHAPIGDCADGVSAETRQAVTAMLARADASTRHAPGVVVADATGVSAETRDASVSLASGTHVCETAPAPSAACAEATGVSAETRDALGAVLANGRGASAQRAPIAVFADGTCVSAETARRLACDCGIVHVTEDAQGNPLSVGRRTRSIPTAIARALLKRDQCCRFPGCANRVYVEGHHVKHWADEGETALGNLVTLCEFHHRFVHEYGYAVELDDAQCPHFFDPRGLEVLDVPERPRPAALGWPAVIDLNAPLAIDPTTNECLWDGDEPSYVDIIDALVRVDGVH